MKKKIIIGLILIVLIIGSVIICRNSSRNSISEQNDDLKDIKYYSIENIDIQNNNSNLFIINSENEKKELKVNLNTKFDIEIGGETYEIKVTKINEDNIKLFINEYGLAPEKESGGISLLKNYDNISIKNGYGIQLVLQNMDYNPYVYIYYSNS